MTELKKMPNIGAELEKLLLLAGINSAEQLIKTGSVEAFTRIKTIASDACYSKFLALEGACQNMRWHKLDKQKKKEIKEIFDILSKK